MHATVNPFVYFRTRLHYLHNVCLGFIWMANNYILLVKLFQLQMVVFEFLVFRFGIFTFSCVLPEDRVTAHL